MIGLRAPVLPFALRTTAAPDPELPYVGEATIYDGAGATGSISGGTLIGAGAIYDQSGATGSISGATVMPAESVL